MTTVYALPDATQNDIYTWVIHAWFVNYRLCWAQSKLPFSSLAERA